MLVEIRDKGPGLPDDFDPKKATSLGMKLIDILSQQLGGSVDLVTDKGTVATLRFKLPPKSGTIPIQVT